jgi:DNA polymerase-3 subunit alpha
LDSASTPELFAKRELELGTGYITVTDHGTLEATRRVYDLTRGKKFKGLKPIIGIEGYFRDDNCPEFETAGIRKNKDGKYKDFFKYGHVTLHAMDEPAFGALSRAISDADLRAEHHGHERKPLFNWKNLEELGAYNITATSGCLIGMVSRHILDRQDPRMAVRYYEKLRASFKPGNFYVEIFPHRCDRNWEVWVYVTDTEDQVHKFTAWKTIKTARGEMKAEELASLFRRSKNAAANHVAIYETKSYQTWTALETPITLKNVVYWEGFTQNECHPWCPDGDVQAGTNKFLMGMAQRYGDPILLGDDSHFAFPEEKVVQDIRLGQFGTWKFANSYHRLSTQESLPYLRDRLGVSDSQVESWVENSYNWASRFDGFEFTPRKTLPVSFYPQDTLKHVKELIDRHGRMDWGRPEYVQRLQAEIKLLHHNGTLDLLPYFMVIEEVCQLYAKNGLLTGPGRGSAAGLLLSYLLSITHVDPLKYNLSMDRFLTLDRIQSGKLPDVDQDLPHRDLLMDPEDWRRGWLRERFGDCVSQISTDISMKLKSAIRDTFRALDAKNNERGEVPPAVEAICRALPDPPQGVDDKSYVFGYQDPVSGEHAPGLLETNATLQDFVKTYPSQWDIVQKLLGLPRQKGRHPCGFIISDEPIQNFIPLTTVGDVRCTSFNHIAVEAAGGLKMDFLRVKGLLDVNNAIRIIQSRHGRPEAAEGGDIPAILIGGKRVPLFRCVPYQGGWVDIYDLPQDQEVYRDICEGRVETVFQLDAPAARQGLQHFKPRGDLLPLNSIESLSAFTALDRPGPLDAMVTAEDGQSHNMLVEYAKRARGERGTGRLPILDKLLPETHGTIVYQEQLQRIFQEIGKTTAIEANNFRQRIGKKKMSEVKEIDYPLFMKGATETLGAAKALELWGQIQTFGQYGFNASHAVSYMFTAYATAWLKHHYPLEWWCAVLQNADRNKIDEKFWRYAGSLIALPDVKLSKKEFEICGDKIQAPLSLLKGLGEKAHEQLLANGPYTDIRDFLEKIKAWKKANAKPGTKKQKDKITGESIQIPCMREPSSALNNTVIQNLIISGAMDSLFPEVDKLGRTMSLEGRLDMYQQVAFEVFKKKVENLGARFALTSPLTVFQLQKKILPAYSVPLAPLLFQTNKDRFDGFKKRIPHYKQILDGQGESLKVREWMMVDGRGYETLTSGALIPAAVTSFAVAAYVIAERRFSYTQKTTGDEKTAVELVVDLDGSRQTVVKWPGKDGLPLNFSTPLDGSVVLCLLSRYEDSQTWFFNDVVVFAHPLAASKEKEESSD